MILSDDLSLIIEGDTKSVAENGVFTFSNIIITGKPLYNSSLKIATNGIDFKKF